MTLHQFLRQHPRSTVGRPSASFPIGVVVCCVVVIVWMLRTFLHILSTAPGSAHDVLALFGALSLSCGLFAGAYVGVRRTQEVLGWRRRGCCSFAVAEAEVLLVSQEGRSVLVPIAAITALEIHIHTVTLTMQPDFPQKDALESVVREVLQPGGDGPTGRAFFNALAPLVRQLVPEARITNTEPSSLWAILRGS